MGFSSKECLRMKYQIGAKIYENVTEIDLKNLSNSIDTVDLTEAMITLNLNNRLTPSEEEKISRFLNGKIIDEKGKFLAAIGPEKINIIAKKLGLM